MKRATRGLTQSFTIKQRQRNKAVSVVNNKPVSGDESYHYHLFISYCGGTKEWDHWAQHRLRKLLEMYLSDKWRPAKICIDADMGPGTDFVEWLGQSIGRSQAMVAIWSEAYFYESYWCPHELDLMFARNGGKSGLIIPVVVEDCSDFPGKLGQIEQADFGVFRVPMSEQSNKYFDMAEAVRLLMPRIYDVVRGAPPFDPAWVSSCLDRLREVATAREAGRRLAPNHYTIPPRQPHFGVIPRLQIRRKAV